MLGDKFGHFLDQPLAPLVRRIHLDPNLLTVIGLLITLLAATVLAVDLVWGGILILAGCAFDLLDGMVARQHDKVTDFGAFFDSVLDRYGDAALFLALAWYFLHRQEPVGAILSLLTLVGALLTSYARARAEGIGKPCTKGVLERPERIILLVFGCLTGWILPVLWIMAVLTHLTVVQRILTVRQGTRREPG
jgi:CDP-diacylglycerol--glycerol-3-phosphate 3-phosphatidyltransferase